MSPFPIQFVYLINKKFTYLGYIINHIRVSACDYYITRWIAWLSVTECGITGLSHCVWRITDGFFLLLDLNFSYAFFFSHTFFFPTPFSFPTHFFSTIFFSFLQNLKSPIMSYIPTSEEINQHQQPSRVKNTDNCTSKWLRMVNKFNKKLI